MKKQLFIALALIFTVSTQIMSRSIIVKNASYSPIMLLPLFSNQTGYEIIKAPGEIGKSVKTYSLGLKTIRQVSWIVLDEKSPKPKYVATINMGPLGSDKEFVIHGNNSYSFEPKGTTVQKHLFADTQKMSAQEQSYFSNK
jgi:hypothetical protein